MDVWTYAWFFREGYPYVGRIHWGTNFGTYSHTRPADELLQVGDPSGIYTPKVGYVKLCTDLFDREEQWWWRKVWKLRCPTKARLIVWTNLENKTPTWDILQKQNHHGLGWCSMCKSESESINHMFISCRLYKQNFSCFLLFCNTISPKNTIVQCSTPF